MCLIDNNGNTVVEYYYDAWGNHKVVDEKGDEITDLDNIGNLNPFRYRGYYYDTETGLYFLQTRYYDPEVGRFLNRDSVQYADLETINGLNLYAYCLNNPIEYTDPYGTTEWWEWLLGGLVIVGLSGLAIAATVISGGLASVGSALVLKTSLDFAATVFGAAAFSGIVSISSQPSDEFSLQQFGIDIGIGAASGAFSYFTGKALGTMFKQIGTILSTSNFFNYFLQSTTIGSIIPEWFLSGVGGLLGSVIGGIGGGIFIDYHANKLLGQNSIAENLFGTNVLGDILSRLLALLG